jgi:hypothetical protein
LDEAIKDLAKALKAAAHDLGVCLDQLCDIVLQHEKRLQEIEKPLDIATEAKYFRTYILGIKDPDERNAALVKLAALYEVLGITDLEA